ncbi:MAG: alpha/beta fold hydrolase [Candidatus Heimdallarchaeota archaeon]|nr:alpha/beta fold hydrolase [Candidatus Heimdallarchaeota archaeon]
MQEVIFPERLKELAQPYFYKAENNHTKTLVILVHGFGASATETRPLGEFLCKNGYDIFGVLLSGHGTVSKDLDNISWKDWYQDIEDAYLQNSEKYEHVFIGGLSLGGALALYTATKLDFEGIFTINALYRFKRIWTLFSWIAHFFKLHRPRNLERVKWYVENDLFAYQDDSTYASYQILKFLRFLHVEIRKIEIPALIIQSQEDKTINPQSAEWIFADLKTKKELMQLEKGDHILTVDENKDIAFEKILGFLKNKISK